MPKLSALLIAILFFAIKANAQNITVTGSVADTAERKAIQNAVVALLTAKDSVLYKFTRTDANGRYSFRNIQPGSYVMMTTHPYFADMVSDIELKENETIVPITALTSKSKLLAEVIVKSGSPIRIKGDTTVYTADSFKVRPGANVEELLKKLPGIQVDKSGKITAMGEQVKKVLVDGEEFFGDDPGIATKNLRADAVKEVEVFDKKSDQAAFTGIDDGVKDKTINLKLKDNAKKGYFGKAEAGTDFNNYYNNSIMANAFRGKRKLAGYGIMSNTGQTNLDWQDNQNYGGSDNTNMEMMDGGGIMITSEGDGDNYWNGRGGIPKNWNGGLHYSNKFNNGKQSLNSGYKISKVNSPSGERNYTTNFVGDSSFSSSRITDAATSKLKQSLNITFETNIDSANSLKFTARGNLNNTRSNSFFDLVSRDSKSLLLNRSSRKTISNTDNEALNSTLLWKHKFKKLARTLTVNMNYNYSSSNTKSNLFSDNEYYSGGILYQQDTTDQENKRDNRTNTFSTTLTYTEPLGKDIFLSASYSFSRIGNTNDRFSYSKDLNGKYTSIIDSLSNSYVFKQTVNKPGISLRVAKKKYNFSIGGDISVSHFEQDNRTTKLLRKYNFTNFFPNASFYKKLSGYGGIRINYNGSTKAPSLDQLQPITDNSDPLNQYIGNPGLDQSFNHSLNLNYSFYNVLKEKGMWSGIYGSITQNAFVNQTEYFSGGKTVRQTVNTNGNYYFNLYSNYNFKWKKPNINISFGPNASVSQNISYIITNGVLQRAANKNQTYGISAGLRKQKENKYEFSIDPSMSWVRSRNSVNSTASANYWQFRVEVDGEVTFLKKFRLESEVQFQAKQKDPRFPAKNEFTLWNASLKRSFYKDKFEASLSVNDILNENRGYDRNFYNNQYTETFYNTLKRFWMVSITWNFSKNGAAPKNF
ncbi:MAG: outer membrane beta-barrel protein [Chitinophagaceae bacterium]|nr:outer membrane beta-barrel protein [Chitinophagaceae bacterium]